MKKIIIATVMMLAVSGVHAQTVVVRQPGLVESLVVGTGRTAYGLCRFTKDLLVGGEYTVTTPDYISAPVPVTAVPVMVPPAGAAAPVPYTTYSPAAVPVPVYYGCAPRYGAGIYYNSLGYRYYY